MNNETVKALGEIFARRFAIDSMDEESSTEPLDSSRANFHAAIDAMQAEIDRLRKEREVVARFSDTAMSEESKGTT